jgi:hypothetical protein
MVLSSTGRCDGRSSDRVNTAHFDCEAAMTKSIKAIRACAKWLSFCLSIGWSKSDLDALEALWWKYRDDNGVLR